MGGCAPAENGVMEVRNISKCTWRFIGNDRAENIKITAIKLKAINTQIYCDGIVIIIFRAFV